MNFTTSAIVLRRTPYSETSLIVSWLSEGHGRVKTMAKGARRPKSAFAGKLDAFFQAEISFARSKGGDLHTLREVALVETFEGIRHDYDRVALAAYFVELIELSTEPEHPAPELYDLLRRALAFLAEKPAAPRALRHFEAELVRLLGIHGQPGVTPILALGRAYGRIPQARAALLRRLEKTA